MVCPDTFGTQDTLGEVSLNEWIDLLNGTGLGDFLKLNYPYAHIGG
jgi:hypothetical protein